MPKKSKETADKTILLGVLGAVAVLAIVGMVMMFSSAMNTAGMATYRAGDYGSMTGGTDRFLSACASKWAGSTFAEISAKDKPCADFLRITVANTNQAVAFEGADLVGSYGTSRYGGPIPGK